MYKICIYIYIYIYIYITLWYLGFVVNAIYTMAYALDKMHKDICGKPGLCSAMIPLNGRLLYVSVLQFVNTVLILC